ncbi:UDP-N-acetylglucosamine 1-carboxyvinyltransferase [Candidatus Parcubacteria bacterium]|nr:UDP-N-acetylglucosamine 1-carboxyvinyltransferase [Patescibacteria group bacterium]MBU4380747.1 UDP-N-acetylglucosamine 1-carboxyvinyltransferase [Patescibacteria group bacterium]MCG2688829.1 UDP-N-acetylglucosamine 1-carboxyvinyltransferase [Candidatus Parcubacteria bacterium]
MGDNSLGSLKIVGGNPLRGTVVPIPNKNSIVVALPASILTDETVIYNNVPQSTDVQKILEMIVLLGGEFTWTSANSVSVCCKNLKSYKVDFALGNLIRASILFAGPLLVRFGVAEIPVPGGCVLGKRSIASHVDVFNKLGIVTEFFDGFVRFTLPKKITSCSIWQNEASVTATENFAMLVAGLSGNTISLTDAACEPHVVDLLKLLSDMGASITGAGSNIITVSGKKLKGATFVAGPDFVDIGGFIVASALTHGNITIRGGNVPEITGGMVNWFRKFGIKIVESGQDLVVDGNCELKIDQINSGFPLAGEDLLKFAPRPWPGFPVDVLPPVVTLACKTNGKLLINNWMYETGLEFCKDLNLIGANIQMIDSQKIIVNGPVTFKGGEVTPPGIIQAVKALFLASLADPVTTVVHNADILKRRYPDIVAGYTSLGANISPV